MDSLQAPLSALDFEALKEVSKGQMQRIISAESKSRLAELRLIREALGGLMLTDQGRMRLAMGK